MAAETYEKLASLYPQHADYKLYHAQSLYSAFALAEAEAAMERVRVGELRAQMSPFFSSQIF